MSEQTERRSIEAADPIPAPAALPAAPAVPIAVPVQLPAEAAGLPSVTVTLTLTPPPPPVPETPAAPAPVDETAKGKAARNERRKARIGFFNGTALAAAGAGLLGPYFTLLQKLPDLIDRIKVGPPLVRADVAQFAVLFGVALAGLGLAIVFHRAAMRLASNIED